MDSTTSSSDAKGFGRVTLNWSPASEIIWTNGRELLQCIDYRDDFYKAIEDVAVKMRERASQDYGLNESYVPDDPKLRSLWTWIESAKEMSTKIPSIDKNDKLIGVRQLLFGSIISDNSSTILKKSDLNYAQWADLPSNAKIPVYKSDERSHSLNLCGWGDKLDSLIENLKAKSQFTRAAAISVFNLKMRKAIECLIAGSAAQVENGGDPNLSTVAMALSGYTGEKNSLWREMCSAFRCELNLPYLKAIFSFLTSETETYEEILYDHSLELSDRVAFAVTFLPDSQLQYHLDTYSAMLVENGHIDGLLMTGITNEGLDLLNRYVEATSDVQTVSFVILHSLPSHHYKDPRVQLWVENYRNILDCWRLWHKRALFDNEWFKRLNYDQVPGPQMFVNCNYCGKSVSTIHSLPLNSISGSGNQLKNSVDHLHALSKVNASVLKARIQSCPNCRKPLPRCCICLTQYGTPTRFSSRTDYSSSSNETGKKKIKPHNSWFSWCQTCRHGGHAKHMMDWFMEQSECPVSGCPCRCISLDTVEKFQS
ncbi:GATOR complex protein MIOS-like [Panonychus citri]|uniref:GATOR complex protein MIOS-like n=1 Tax=Panonychus citri TaxID=50023 RepID=UPI0023072805|nr:GATOR complex protein MIOS-like [Panonychus citri]